METPSSVRDMSEFASSDEDGMDWEEVVPSSYGQDGNTGLQDTLEIDVPGQQPIEITLPTAKSKEQAKKTQARARTLEWRAQQVVRLESHKLHTVCLLSSAWIRNKWINDPLLHARLMSMTPMPIQNSFLMIHKKFQPDPVQRGRLFQAAVGRLTKWWHENFEVHPNGHITSKTFNEALREPQADDNIREPLRGPKSLMKHALAWYGSRDTSALLFTALCRALGVPARLVVSLQSVPWRRSVERTDGPDQSASKKDPKGKGKARAVENGGQESSASDTLDTGKTKPAPKSVTKLKGSKRKSIKSRSATPKHFSLTAEEISPTMWTEVFSRADMRWLPVDPIRNIVNQRQKLEPHPQDKANRMVYVVAFEEDGFARDVTFRYAKAFGGVTVKSRPGGKLRTDGWWESVMSMVTRPYRLKRDDIEDEEFVIKQVTEGMPTSMTGFKDHPVYVLERHIRQTEVIHPKREVGKFRGESVYHRSNVLALKSSENWMRVGRRVREGHQPLKMVKARATTVHRRRALEMAQAETGEESLQGLYSEAQTELFIPDPVIDGKIPKNDFGNIDLYVPSMLPRGAVHVPHKGTAKIARELKIDYAEAVTGFEFRKGHGIPILTGVVVAEEHEELLLDAYWESVHDAEEKERLKRTERVIQRWTKLIHGLRIRKRMQEQYQRPDQPMHDGAEEEEEAPIAEQGGFVSNMDSVIQHYNLPKPVHNVDVSYQEPFKESALHEEEETDEPWTGPVLQVPQNPDQNSTDDSPAPYQNSSTRPMTMEAFAEASSKVVTPKIETAPKEILKKKGTQPKPSKTRATKSPTRKPVRKRRRAELDESDDEASSLVVTTAASTPEGGRKLRPRAPKSAEKIRAEREAEEALRLALEEE